MYYANDKFKQENKKKTVNMKGCLGFGRWTSRQDASVSQGRGSSEYSTSYHAEIEVAFQMFYVIQSQNTDTRHTSPSTETVTSGAGSVASTVQQGGREESGRDEKTSKQKPTNKL